MAKKVLRFTRTPEAHKPLAAPEATKVQCSRVQGFAYPLLWSLMIGIWVLFVIWQLKLGIFSI